MTLVDASSWIEFLRGRTSEPGRRVAALLESGEAAWCEITMVELWNGARGQPEKAALKEFEADLQLCLITEQVWAQARNLASRCREKGLTIPTADIVVAACAVHYGVALEHCDRHFDRILPLAKK
jgi:predicted nucleic acid-binding protein